eukprot:6775110-Pyramimonas_sp.AAC.1
MQDAKREREQESVCESMDGMRPTPNVSVLCICACVRTLLVAVQRHLDVALQRATQYQYRARVASLELTRDSTDNLGW